MTPTTRRVAAALAALAAALFLSSCSSPTSDGQTAHQQTDQPVITAQPAGYNADDVAFATNMIPHREQAVELSAMVPTAPPTPNSSPWPSRSRPRCNR